MLALYQRFDLRILFTIIACLLVPITLLARHGATGILIGMFTIAVCFKHQNKTGFKLTWTPSGVAFFLTGCLGPVVAVCGAQTFRSA
jgi:nitrate reductase NapE component